MLTQVFVVSDVVAVEECWLEMSGLMCAVHSMGGDPTSSMISVLYGKFSGSTGILLIHH